MTLVTLFAPIAVFSSISGDGIVGHQVFYVEHVIIAPLWTFAFGDNYNFYYQDFSALPTQYDWPSSCDVLWICLWCAGCPSLSRQVLKKECICSHCKRSVSVASYGHVDSKLHCLRIAQAPCLHNRTTWRTSVLPTHTQSFLLTCHHTTSPLQHRFQLDM